MREKLFFAEGEEELLDDLEIAEYGPEGEEPKEQSSLGLVMERFGGTPEDWQLEAFSGPETYFRNGEIFYGDNQSLTKEILEGGDPAAISKHEEMLESLQSNSQFVFDGMLDGAHYASIVRLTEDGQLQYENFSHSIIEIENEEGEDEFEIDWLASEEEVEIFETDEIVEAAAKIETSIEKIEESLEEIVIPEINDDLRELVEEIEQVKREAPPLEQEEVVEPQTADLTVAETLMAKPLTESETPILKTPIIEGGPANTERIFIEKVPAAISEQEMTSPEDPVLVKPKSENLEKVNSTEPVLKVPDEPMLEEEEATPETQIETLEKEEEMRTEILTETKERLSTITPEVRGKTFSSAVERSTTIKVQEEIRVIKKVHERKSKQVREPRPEETIEPSIKEEQPRRLEKPAEKPVSFVKKEKIQPEAEIEEVKTNNNERKRQAPRRAGQEIVLHIMGARRVQKSRAQQESLRPHSIGFFSPGPANTLTNDEVVQVEERDESTGITLVRRR